MRHTLHRLGRTHRNELLTNYFEYRRFIYFRFHLEHGTVHSEEFTCISTFVHNHYPVSGTNLLKTWLNSNIHIQHPYPSEIKMNTECEKANKRYQ